MRRDSKSQRRTRNTTRIVNLLRVVFLVRWGPLGGPKLKGLQKGEKKERIVRKSVVSIKFPPVILGPEMAAPILWAPGIFWFFLLENPHAHKIPPFRGGFWVFSEGGGGSANFIYGRGDFSDIGHSTRF